MAEWTGRKRTINSVPLIGEPPVGAASDFVPSRPKAPGATNSPQLPGETPDTPDLPGRSRGSLPPLRSNRRPLTEYGSAQRLLGLFTPKVGVDLVAADWEQGDSAHEERRKADSTLLTPDRPLTGHGLGLGRSAPAIAPEVLEAIGNDTSEVSLPVPDGAPGDIVESSAIPAQAATASPADTTAPSESAPGDGTTTCAPGYPIKGNAQSMIYHDVGSRWYQQTIADICFASIVAAETAGFRPAQNL